MNIFELLGNINGANTTVTKQNIISIVIDHVLYALENGPNGIEVNGQVVLDNQNPSEYYKAQQSFIYHYNAVARDLGIL